MFSEFQDEKVRHVNKNKSKTDCGDIVLRCSCLQNLYFFTIITVKLVGLGIACIFRIDQLIS